MKIKPFVSINFCYTCKSPIPRLGLFMRTSVGNASVTSPFVCPKCASKRKKFEQNLSKKNH